MRNTDAKKLIMAAYSGDMISVEAAIGAKVDLDTTDKNGLTALHWAAIDGHSNVVKLLLKQGASPYIKDKYGRTAAQAAASKQHGQIVSILQEYVAMPANREKRHEYILPPLELLYESPHKSVGSEKDARKKQAIIIETLNGFEVGVHVARVLIGSIFTRFEVWTEPSIPNEKIASLEDHLARRMSTKAVRMEASISDSFALGIEVPNEVQQIVSLRECLATNEFMNTDSKLTFVVGKNVFGEFKYARLNRMPHLLVGGSANGDKSVFW